METEETEKMKDNLDWKGFLERTGMKKSEIARCIGAAPAMITDWTKGKNQPSWIYLRNLGKVGMTAQEMFGEEIGNSIVRNSIDIKAEGIKSLDILKTPEFRNSVLEILRATTTSGEIPDVSKLNNFLDRQVKEDSQENK